LKGYTMTKTRAKHVSSTHRQNELMALINEADQSYYIHSCPVLTDYDYDRMVHELRELEADNGVITGSPTQRIGDGVVGDFQRANHKVRMLSLDNTYSLVDLSNWISAFPDHEDFHMVDQWKVDGLALSVIYKDGVLMRAATRGTGDYGDDVTINARAITNLPLTIPSKGVVEVRGEVYISNANFAILQEADPTIANSRNLAAGTMKSKEGGPRKVRDRRLAFIAHGIAEGLEGMDSLSAVLSLLEEYEFEVLHSNPTVSVYTEDVIALIDRRFTQLRDNPPHFPIDGFVVKLDSRKAQAETGVGSKFVHWGVAYKFAPEQATTKLVKLDWQVGKSGVVTPRATLEPVNLCGTTISHATVHNAQRVMDLGLYDGCTVVIEKAGEIIPQISRVENPSTAPTPRGTCQPPSEVDGILTEMRGPRLFLTEKHPDKQLKEQLVYWGGRKQMDVGGLGPSVIDKLVDGGYVKRVPDLYNLPLLINTISDGVYANLIVNINASKDAGMAAVMCSFGYTKVGHHVSEMLSQRYSSIWDLMDLGVADFQAMPGVGEVVAEFIVSFLRDHKADLKMLEECGVSMQSKKPETHEIHGKFVGQRACVTGKLKLGSRDNIHAILRAHGAEIHDSIKSDTTLLVVGDKAGSKLQKATNMGITILTEDAFYEQVD